ncbi:hypothetical protein Peur_037345 [Populus x canadensis]
MLVAVERKPTMVHGGYDGGGQCLLQLFFFFPVQRTSLCCFFSSASVWFFSFWSLVGVELLVAFRRCGGGCWPVELLWGAMVALLLSMQRCEPLFFFFFFVVDRYSLLSGGVVAAVDRKTNGGSPFSFLLPLAGAVVMENGSGCWTKKMS